MSLRDLIRRALRRPVRKDFAVKLSRALEDVAPFALRVGVLTHADANNPETELPKQRSK